jgi:hypothetical protein
MPDAIYWQKLCTKWLTLSWFLQLQQLWHTYLISLWHTSRPTYTLVQIILLYNFRNLKAKAEHKIWFHRQQRSDEPTASILRVEFGEMVQVGKTDTVAWVVQRKYITLKGGGREVLRNMGKNTQKCKQGGGTGIAWKEGRETEREKKDALKRA